MSRAEVDRAERHELAPGAVLRPRDAATLILLDRSGGELRVLMGRRHARHAFMPGKFVFPGGRTDPEDARVRAFDALDPAEAQRIGGSRGPARARAIALSAIRETYEEAGILIGRPAPFATARQGWQAFADHGIAPRLGALRFVARAVTPPGRVRRFDTRFLACWREEAALALPSGPSGELDALAWLTLSEARETDLPSITRTVLDELEQRLAADPLLRPGGPVPYYRLVRDRFVRTLL